MQTETNNPLSKIIDESGVEKTIVFPSVKSKEAQEILNSVKILLGKVSHFIIEKNKSL